MGTQRDGFFLQVLAGHGKFLQGMEVLAMPCKNCLLHVHVLGNNHKLLSLQNLQAPEPFALLRFAQEKDGSPSHTLLHERKVSNAQSK